MNMKPFFLIAFTAIMFLALCKTEHPFDITKFEWQAMVIQDSLDHVPVDEYILEFEQPDKYLIILKKNFCSGRASVGDSRIHFTDLECTKVCCEKEFGQLLQKYLPSVYEFHREGNQLIMTGVATIIFVQK